MGTGNRIFKSSSVVFWCYLLFFCTSKINAQVNYVQNPSLEKYDTCPYQYDQIKFAYYWSAIDSDRTTQWGYGQPEYISECASNVEVSAPLNDRFYHFPRTGKGMANILVFADSNQLGWDYQRDYLQGRFIKPLVAGKSYCVTFYVANEQQNNYAINHIDAYLDNGKIDTTHHPSLPQTQYMPQILNTTIISDVINWVKVEGSYTANGSEKFITIGNFFNLPNTAHVIFDTNSISSPGGANYLIDDVSVIESDHVAFAGNDTSIYKGDSILLGEIAVPYTWYKDSAGLRLIDSTSGGIWVRPDTNTTYVVKQTLCGVITWDTVVVSVMPVSVNSVQRTVNSVRVWPNPVGDMLHIENAKNCTIHIFDVVGREVYSGVMNQEKEIIETRDFAKGVYFLEVKNKEGWQQVQKIAR